MEILNMRNQKSRLQYYNNSIQQIMKICNDSIHLRKQQKERLEYFLSRSIDYCNTMKVKKYEKIYFKNDKETQVKTQYQYSDYFDIHRALIHLCREINDDTILNGKVKIRLIHNLSYAIGHITGKLNSHFKNNIYIIPIQFR